MTLAHSTVTVEDQPADPTPAAMAQGPTSATQFHEPPGEFRSWVDQPELASADQRARADPGVPTSAAPAAPGSSSGDAGSWLRRAAEKFPMSLALACVTAVWVLGCVWSFAEQKDFAQAKGFADPELLPLVLDGLGAAMAGVAFAASLDARPAIPARIAMALAVLCSAASNGAWAYERSAADPTTVLVGVVVPIVANVALEVLLAELRRRVQRRRGLPAPAALPSLRLARLLLGGWPEFAAWRREVLAVTATVTDASAATPAASERQSEPINADTGANDGDAGPGHTDGDGASGLGDTQEREGENLLTPFERAALAQTAKEHDLTESADELGQALLVTREKRCNEGGGISRNGLRAGLGLRGVRVGSDKASALKTAVASLERRLSEPETGDPTEAFPAV